MFHEEQKKMLAGRFTNESGVALVSALLILMLLTIVSLTATDTTIVEKAVVRSEAIFEQTFYLAESGAYEAVQKMLNEDDRANLIATEVLPGSPNEDLLRGSGNDEDPKNDMSNLDGNIAAGGNNDGMIDGDDFTENADVGGTTTYRTVVQIPIQPGSSIKGGQSRLYDYLSYGFSQSNSGRALVKVGFKKRFK